jgi:hypothetical protein
MTPTHPAWRELPPEREFSSEFLYLREQVYARLERYYDRDHLVRAGDWMLVLAPEAPEYLVLAALTHDLERDVPGGPVSDKASMPWDDEAYNRAHCERSAEIVSTWLAELGASPEIVDGVREPIREHEFGGSHQGDLMQAADSISFLETNAGLVASWILRGECSVEKGREKLRWMYQRVRLGNGRAIARPYFDEAMTDLDRQLLAAGHHAEVTTTGS